MILTIIVYTMAGIVYLIGGMTMFHLWQRYMQKNCKHKYLDGTHPSICAHGVSGTFLGIFWLPFVMALGLFKLTLAALSVPNRAAVYAADWIDSK